MTRYIEAIPNKVSAKTEIDIHAEKSENQRCPSEKNINTFSASGTTRQDAATHEA
ncbi:hypothetical protein ACWPKO_02260 [Coraliomargarita sp. W4R53]